LKKHTFLAWGILASLFTGSAPAASIYFSGTFDSPESSTEFILTLASPTKIYMQTFGFGGGLTATGVTVPAGGTDPFLAIFSGTGSNATIVTDASSNTYGTSIDLSNYDNPLFYGCGSAHQEDVNGTPVCGDIYMTPPTLAAGVYTIVISDGQYQANAVFDNGTLGEGFNDFTGGIFCNVVVDASSDACPNNSGAWGLQFSSSSDAKLNVQELPEPATWGMAGLTLLGFIAGRRFFATSK
jgi:PEP-CTERM motif-containing protein